jgi:uncharacterized protein (DUF1015 family)
MAEIQPFRAVHYSPSCAKDLDRIITPPYDVISREEQDAFYSAHPLNIIRLVLGKQNPDDSPSNNRYTRAAGTLKQWLQEGVLVRSDQPAFTIYQMEFAEPDGGRGSIDGIVALVKVDDYGKGKVLPHEKTYKGPKQDQLSLLRSCRASFTPIHALFSDDHNVVGGEYGRLMEGPPEQEARDVNGSVHRTWSIRDEESIAKIRGVLAEKSLFIADGHHRYETALAFRNEERASGRAQAGGPHEYVMMYITSMSHPGLTILPAHRLVKGLADLDLGQIETILEPYFSIEELCYTTANRDEVSNTLVQRIRSYSNVGGKFGMVVQGENCFRLLRLKDYHAVDSLMDVDIPSSLRGLDVTILREIILGHALGLDKENAEGQIEYTPLVSEALNRVLKGEIQVSFILNPTRVDQMRTAAELGHKLPHKSTYFYPKISSGLVLNVF